MKNLSTMKKAKQTRRKLISVAFAVIILLSFSSISAFARSNSWGLVVSQVDTSYFYRHIDQNGWSQVRKRCYADAQNLSSRFNSYIVQTNYEQNVINQLEYIYSNYDQTTATTYGNQWNNLNVEISNLITDVEQLCGGGSAVPRVNGQEVTTEAYQNMIADIAEKNNTLSQLVININSSYNAATYKAVDITNSYNLTAFELFTTLWNQLGIFINTIGSSHGSATLFGVSWSTDSIQEIADLVSPFIKTFAYALAVALFGINVSRSALQFELMETKGQIKIFAGVILVKVWIDLAVTICLYIINIINNLSIQIINAFTMQTAAFTTFSSSLVDATTNESFNGVGALINFFYRLLWTLPSIILMIVLVISIISVILKLIARGFEMTALVTVSPIFFATLVGEETKAYFKKFMSSFLSTCCSLLFIVIVYAVATIWIHDSTEITDTSLIGIVTLFGTSFYRCLIVLAACRIIRKPPKVLTDLVAV